MSIPSRSESSIRSKDFYKATLIDDGILITSQGHVHNGSPDHDQQFNISRNHDNSGTSLHSIQSNNTFLETASLVSCVTCLSDNDQMETQNRLRSSLASSGSSRIHNTSDNREEIPYSTISGQLLANTVIPYGRILNAKYITNSNGFNDRPDNLKTGSASNSTSYADVFVPRCDDSESPENESEIENQIENPFCDYEDSDTGDKASNYKYDASYGANNMKKNINRKDDYSLVEITLAKPRRHDIVPKRLILSINNMNSSSTVDIVEEILERSYKNVKRERSILVIINPHGGKGNAKKLFMSKCKPIILASKCSIDMAYTKYARHAIDIAREVDIDKYDTIACASGDGIPYEVMNGLFQRPDRADAFNKLAITQLPCGSGNAMSVSCHWTSNPSYAALCLVKSVESRIDLMCCSQQSYLETGPRLSFLSQTYGIIAESDINTEFIRWMGPARFELGVAFNVLQRKKYPCDIYVKYAAKSKNELKVHYLEHKNKATLSFEPDVEPENDTDELLESESSNRLSYPITEQDFKLKYPLDEGVPSDWEKVDSGVTENLGIFYTGKMPYIAADTKFFPAALPADGAMDLVITDARTPVTRMAPILLGLDRGSHVLQPEVIHSKIIAYKLVPKITNSLFSVDGEKFPLEPLQVEVLPRLCKTLLRNGSYVDTEFDSM